jgi:drug/metabolite transporter (DMT)-like permease
MFLSPGRTGAGIASVLGNTQPVIVPALAVVFLGERMTRGKWIALAFGLIGVALIASPALAGPDAYGVSGPMLALAASGGLAVGSVIVKRIGATIDLLALTAWQLIVGSLPLLAVSVVVEHNAVVVWNATLVGLLLFLALIGTAFATALWYWLIRHDDVGRLTMFFFLVPVFGLAIAALAFGEAISLWEGAGVIVTLAGIGAIAWESWPAHAPPPTQRHTACSCGLPGYAGTFAGCNRCRA